MIAGDPTYTHVEMTIEEYNDLEKRSRMFNELVGVLIKIKNYLENRDDNYDKRVSILLVAHRAIQKAYKIGFKLERGN